MGMRLHVHVIGICTHTLDTFSPTALANHNSITLVCYSIVNINALSTSPLPNLHSANFSSVSFFICLETISISAKNCIQYKCD